MMIERVDPLHDIRWDEKVALMPEASFFHGSAWLRVLHDSYGFAPFYFIASVAHQTSVWLPMIEVNSWLTGKRGVSLPFTDECEPLGDTALSAEDLNYLLREVVVFGKQRRWKRVEFRGGKSYFPTAPSSVSFWGHRLKLSSDIPALFAALDSSTRRSVRKAEQCGLTIEFSRSVESVQNFRALLAKTRQRHGMPPQPSHFFAKLHQHVLAPGNGWVVLAKSKGLSVAGAVFLHSGISAIYKYGASDETYQQLRGNNLVMWRAIEWYAQNGFDSLDFGRTSLGNAGLRRFKLGWGTTERTIDYFRYNLRTNAFETGRDAAAGWHNHVFRLLPRWASQLISAALYKHTA